ncbi:MAG: peptidylprolyl isomerase [Saprospiraceae bacterium]|nr:peptidylprolyl isomerase [Saprospiraceae bacterium]
MHNLICVVFVFFALLFSNNIEAQDDPVLFKVNNKEVNVSEFQYIYDKTNGEKADYSEKSIKEYLELYVNFKLQVAEGIDIGLSEKPEVKREQDQYKKQLASTYLTDREITEKLVMEAYERSKEDRKISHLLIAVDENATEQVRKEAFEKAQKVKNELTADNFNELVVKYSDDLYSKNNGGVLGYYTALQLPYAIETAAYNTAKGAYSDIVSTKYGFHILRIDDVREAWGKVKVAHVLLRTKKDPNGAKVMIDSLHEALIAGAKFEQIATMFSQDNATKNRGGQLGWVGINKYSVDFENAIFGLKVDGNFSKPVKSDAGWHILKRYQGIKNAKYQDVKSEITNQIKRKPRFQIIQDALVSNIKKEGGYKENETTKKALIDSLTNNNTFLTYKWKSDKNEALNNMILFDIGNIKASVREFMSIAQRAHSERLNQQPRTVEAAVNRIIKKLATQKCLAYEETQLDKKYPEFKSLMREYEEGILLFEVKKQLVWDKASSDEEGLKAYYEAHKSNFKWGQRANVTFYTVLTDDNKLVKKIQNAAKNKSAESVKGIFNKDKELVQTTTGIYEEGKNMELDKLKWKAGVMNKGYTKDGSTYFTKIEEIIAPSIKSLEEARGYVVADYQDSLEKQLIQSLKEKFKVEIYEEVLKSMVK